MAPNSSVDDCNCLVREPTSDGNRRAIDAQVVEIDGGRQKIRLCKVGDDVDEREATVLRVVHVSDTHGKHDEIVIPDGDVLVHSGDFFNRDDPTDFEQQTAVLDEFFSRQTHRHKIFVAGNHEIQWHGKGSDEIQSRLKHVTYLQDGSLTIDGVLFYGSPWTGDRQSKAYAFTAPYDELRAKFWSRVPRDTDILVTHSPPREVLDVCPMGTGLLGSLDLRDEILTRIRPLAHLFGHAHYPESRVVIEDRILFSNGTSSAKPSEPESLLNVIDVYKRRQS